MRGSETVRKCERDRQINMPRSEYELHIYFIYIFYIYKERVRETEGE